MAKKKRICLCAFLSAVIVAIFCWLDGLVEPRVSTSAIVLCSLIWAVSVGFVVAALELRKEQKVWTSKAVNFYLLGFLLAIMFAGWGERALEINEIKGVVGPFKTFVIGIYVLGVGSAEYAARLAYNQSRDTDVAK